MNRRAFLKFAFSVLAVAARLSLPVEASHAGVCATWAAGAYGAGAYGAAAYAGFAAFAPAVGRGGN
jgi:hypothetical protein